MLSRKRVILPKAQMSSLQSPLLMMLFLLLSRIHPLWMSGFVISSIQMECSKESIITTAGNKLLGVIMGNIIAHSLSLHICLPLLSLLL